jgi:uncharacterized protein (DUF2336 family)
MALTSDFNLTERSLPGKLRYIADKLRSGDLDADTAALAYLAVIDSFRPRPSGLLTGDRPRRDGATVPLHE